MGGIGSTRWRGHDKKQCVEDCKVLSVFALNHQGVLLAESWHSGEMVWQEAYSQRAVGSIGFIVNTQNESPYLRLHYDVRHWSLGAKSFDYAVPLEITECFFGGSRWWFTCPLIKRGQLCGKRTGKLFLPPGVSYFGCRHCYDLSYRSRQERSDEEETMY